MKQIEDTGESLESIRELGALEFGMEMLERVGSGHIVRVIECDGRLDPTSLDAALQDLVARMPLLRTRIARPPDAMPFFTWNDARPSVSVEERRGPTDWVAAFHQQLNTPLDNDGPLVRVHALTSDGDGAEILVSMHHSLCDGRAIQDFCTELVLQYERRLGGDVLELAETAAKRTVSPRADELLPTWLSGERLQELTEELLKNPVFSEAAPARFVDERGQATAPSVTHMHSYRIPADQLNGLISLARQNGTTVHGALTSALLLASAASGKVEEVDKPFTLQHTMDLRPFLREPLDMDDMGMYSSGVMTSSSDVATTSFWELARDMRQLMDAAMERHEHLVTTALAAQIISHNTEARKFPCMSLVSNLGRVDIPTEASSLRVRSIHGGTPVHGWGTSMLYCLAVGVPDGLLFNLFHPFPEMTDETATLIGDHMLEEFERNSRAR